MLESGDLAGATVLRREFLDRFPGHPVASWDRIVLWPEAGSDAGPTANARSSRRDDAPLHHESRTTNG
jgi:hypothetical protein